MSKETGQELRPRADEVIESMESSQLEERHVHQVYSKIASHFSQTRYRAWPVVEAFLLEMPGGSLGADIGCGNGKYLKVNPKLQIIGTDRYQFPLTFWCLELCGICRGSGHEVFVADNLSLPFRDALFDFVLSIAVIHHFSSPERRLDAIKVDETNKRYRVQIHRILRTGGRALIFVWAHEQKGKRQYEHQDVLVSWMLTDQHRNSEMSDIQPSFDRYYHMFRQGELEELVSRCPGFKINQSGYDRDNWYVVVEKLCSRQ